MGKKKAPSTEIQRKISIEETAVPQPQKMSLKDEPRRNHNNTLEKNEQREKEAQAANEQTAKEKAAKEQTAKEQAVERFNTCRLLAEQGSKEAQCQLAIMYEEGLGTHKNIKLAVEWYEKATSDSEGKQGLKEALCRLGTIYFTGTYKHESQEQRESVARGLELWHLAAKRNYAEAQYFLAVAYNPLLMTEPAEIMKPLKNAEKAFEWLNKAADNGHSGAQFELGIKYEKENDEPRALEWLKKAAETYGEAQFYLGVKYQEGRGVKKNEVKAFEFLNQAAKKGHSKARSYLQQLIKSIRPHNIYPEIKQLIDVTHTVLGESYKVDVSKMFHTLWQEGIPELKDETFYYYTYKIYSSREDIPKIKDPETVYLYIENDELHYQLLKHTGTLAVCRKSVTLTEEERKMELRKLKDVSFVDEILTPGEDIRKIFYRLNDDKTKCFYMVVRDDGKIDIDIIAIAPEDTPVKIEAEILAHSAEQYCLSKEKHLMLLKETLDEQLIDNGCFEPSYEDRKVMHSPEDEGSSVILAPYPEIYKYEKNFQKFLNNLIIILNHNDFIEIFKGNGNFEVLRNKIISIATKLQEDQEIICGALSKPVQNSSQMIDNLKNAYEKAMNLECYYDMVGLMQDFNSLYNHKKEAQTKDSQIKAQIKAFFQKNPELVLAVDSTGLDLPAIFSGQFGTRRRMLFQNIASYFRKKHPKFYELELVFCLVNKLSSAANLAQTMSSPDISTVGSNNTASVSNITSNLEKENNKLKNICFNLVKPIWSLLVLDVQQAGSKVIYKTLVGEKAKILSTLSDLNKLLSFLLKKDLFENLSIAINRDEIDKLIGAIISRQFNPPYSDEIDKIITKMVHMSYCTISKDEMSAIVQKMVKDSNYYVNYNKIINSTEEIEKSCDLNRIISCVVNINKSIAEIATMLHSQNSEDSFEQIQSPKIGQHKLERGLSEENSKGSHDTSDGSSDHTPSLGTAQHTSDDLSDPSRSPKNSEGKSEDIADLPLSSWREDRRFNTVSGRALSIKKGERALVMSGPFSPKRSEGTRDTSFQVSPKKGERALVMSGPFSPKRSEGTRDASIQVSPKKGERALVISGPLSPKQNEEARDALISSSSNNDEYVLDDLTDKQTSTKNGPRKYRLSDHFALSPRRSEDSISKGRRQSLKLPKRVPSNLSSVSTFFNGGNNNKDQTPGASLSSSQKLTLDS